MMQTLFEYAKCNQPKLLAEWDLDLNTTCSMSDFGAHSGKKVYWKCKKGHSHLMAICKKVEGQKCPICHNKIVLFGYNDLESRCPKIADEWDSDCNVDTPKDIVYSSHQYRNWVCKECGNKWSAQVYKRTQEGTGCPACGKKKSIVTRQQMYVKKTGGFARNYPALMDEWDYEKNRDIDAERININSKKIVYWKCKRCGYNWKEKIINRVHGGKCPVCSNKVVVSGINDLLSQNSEVAIEWNEFKNGVSASEIYVYSRKKYYWICSICGREFETTPLLKKRLGCPECLHIQDGVNRRKRLASIRGSILQEKYENIMLDWDYEANYEMCYFPEEMTEKSNVRVNWKCHICGYKWVTSVAHRVLENTGCASCSCKIFVQGKNDLATVAPELIEEWYTEKNKVDVYNVIASSMEKYWWKCKICGNLWQASPHNRVAGTNCPACQGASTSFSEQAVFYYIKMYNEDAINRYIDKKTKLEIDVYIPSKKIGIEYDGYYYHKDKREQDDRKTEILQGNGIKLIRIREMNDRGKYLPQLLVEPYYVFNFDRRKKYEGLDIIIKQILCILENGFSDRAVNIKEERFNILHVTYQGRKGEGFKNSNSEHIQFWDSEKNYPLTPSDITPKSHILVWWRCKKCGFSWERKVSDQVKSKGCPFCNKQVVSENYNLGVLYPAFANEWNVSKNNLISPFDVMPGSKKKYWWTCNICENIYQMSPSARIHGSGCPKCGITRSAKSRKKAVLQLAIDNCNVIREFSSAREAYVTLGISYKGISACCNGKKKSCGGYAWRFKE